jgi:hypothetical protein
MGTRAGRGKVTVLGKKRKESQQSGLTGKRKENHPLLAIKGHGC